MKPLVAVFLTGVVCGCPRVSATAENVPACVDGCTQAQVVVTTHLKVGDPLTDAECQQLCDPYWCSGFPIATPGCTLIATDRVLCVKTAYDCGYCVHGCQTQPSACGGCCDFASNCCRAAPLSCKGLMCGNCPADDTRCSVAACRAFKQCGGQLQAEPTPGVCNDALDFADAGADVATYCPDACNAMGAGDVVQAGCADGGVDAGMTDAGGCGCEAQRATCEADCSRATTRACIDCAAACAMDSFRCSQRCL